MKVLRLIGFMFIFTLICGCSGVVVEDEPFVVYHNPYPYYSPFYYNRIHFTPAPPRRFAPAPRRQIAPSPRVQQPRRNFQRPNAPVQRPQQRNQAPNRSGGGRK